jgi:Spy/CpxP family protein refolding chaperone
MFLLLGLLVGAAGATLFVRSLPPPEGTEAEKVAELERVVARDRLRIASLEATEANAAARLERLAATGRRSILQDLKDGRTVDLNDVFNTAKPFLHEFSPLMERMRRRDQKRRIEHTVADLAERHGLDASQKEGLKQWLEARAAEQEGRIQEMTGHADSTLVDYAKAMRDFQPLDTVDPFMEGALQGEALDRYRRERLEERAHRVQYEAEQRVNHLQAVVALDDTQQDQVFALMARGSRDFDPSMQFEGLGEDRAALTPGQSRDDAIMAVLRPEQRAQYEAHRAQRRQEAEAEAAEIGLKLPDDWDVFEW